MPISQRLQGPWRWGEDMDSSDRHSQTGWKRGMCPKRLNPGGSTRDEPLRTGEGGDGKGIYLCPEAVRYAARPGLFTKHKRLEL